MVVFGEKVAGFGEKTVAVMQLLVCPIRFADLPKPDRIERVGDNIDNVNHEPYFL